MFGYRVRVSKELHAFLSARSESQGISCELLIERLVELAFPNEFVGMLGTPDDLGVSAMSARPVVGGLAIDDHLLQRLG